MLLRILTLVPCMLLAACSSMGPMKLSHQSHPVNQYPKRGTVRVAKFIDYRPMREQMLGADDDAPSHVRKVALTIKTRPAVSMYFQSALKHDLSQSHIFTPTDEQSPYELTGILYHLALNEVIEQQDNPLFDAQGRVAVARVHDEQYYSANVKFLAVLKHNGKIVFRDTIEVEKSLPFVKKISAQAKAKLLDDAVTQAIATLLHNIEQKPLKG